MKYIVTVTDDGKEEIFIFPCSVPHNVMAESVARMKNKSYDDWKRISRTPVSAGFIQGGKCVGNSESLRISSREQDTELLKMITYATS